MRRFQVKSCGILTTSTRWSGNVSLNWMMSFKMENHEIEVGNFKDPYGRETFGVKITVNEGWFQRFWSWLKRRKTK